MNRKSLSLLLSFAVLSLPISVCATTQDNAKLLEPIRELHSQQQNTGFSFVMSHKGKIVLRDFAGFADLSHNIPVTPSTRFSIMSITKAFTGIMLLKAIAQEKVNLDDPVNKFLPNYRGANADQITIAMLLNHTSGIPHTGHPQRKQLYVEHFENATAAMTEIERLEISSTPGKEYLYSSSGYNLLAAILEKIYQKPIQELLAELITEPLKMQDTGYLNVQKNIETLARNYSFVDIWKYSPSDTLQLVPTWDFSYNYGGGNMYSTADDLLSLGEAVMSDTWLESTQKSLISKRLEPKLSSWSAGWIVSEDAEPFKTFHITGATPGVQASLYVLPFEGIVFAMVANSWGKNSAGGKLVIDAPIEVIKRYLEATQ